VECGIVAQTEKLKDKARMSKESQKSKVENVDRCFEFFGFVFP